MDGNALEIGESAGCCDGPASLPFDETASAKASASPLEIENLILRNEAGYWNAMHGKAVAREKALEKRIEELEAKLRLREQQLFARRSERGGKGSFQKTGAKESSKGKRGQRKGGEGHGRRRHEGLPSHVEDRDLFPGDRFCECCGLRLRRLSSTEDSEQVEVEVRAHRRVIRRQRYERACDCPDLPRTFTAPKPPKLIPKGAYGISLNERSPRGSVPESRKGSILKSGESVRGRRPKSAIRWRK